MDELIEQLAMLPREQFLMVLVGQLEELLDEAFAEGEQHAWEVALEIIDGLLSDDVVSEEAADDRPETPEEAEWRAWAEETFGRYNYQSGC